MAAAVEAPAGGVWIGVLVDLAGDVDPAGHTVDVVAAELQQLALAQPDECGEHTQQPEPLGHRVDDDGQLIEGRWDGDVLDRRSARAADLRWHPEPPRLHQRNRRPA